MKTLKPFGAGRALMDMKTIAMFLFVLSCASAVAEEWRTVDAAQAKQQFERLKKLAGQWEGASTKGWENKLTVRVIARGTAMLSTSEFIGENGEGMATLYFFDRGQLKLTHYCEAGNQPTLALTAISADGKKLDFTFHSGTGMESRDNGHMDRLIVELVDEGHRKEQWSWYSKGKQMPMEDVVYRRANAK
jgi:hypothetical protein